MTSEKSLIFQMSHFYFDETFCPNGLKVRSRRQTLRNFGARRGPFFQEAPLHDCSKLYATLNSLVSKFQSYLKILAHRQSIPRPRILMSTISLPQHPDQMIPKYLN